MITSLSKNFGLREFTASSTAIKLGIDNTPNQLQISRMKALCDVILEPTRTNFGNRPIKIISGFRSSQLNKAVGGASNSQHLFGEAADIEINGIKNDEIWQFIVSTLNFDQCIAEVLEKEDGSAGWVHVSHKESGTQRKDAISFLGKEKGYVSGLVYV